MEVNGQFHSMTAIPIDARGLGAPQSRSGCCEETNHSPAGFRNLIIQSVVRHYSDFHDVRKFAMLRFSSHWLLT
jgi:hypothetical protein